jgi:hypothetical protein
MGDTVKPRKPTAKPVPRKRPAKKPAFQPLTKRRKKARPATKKAKANRIAVFAVPDDELVLDPKHVPRSRGPATDEANAHTFEVRERPHFESRRPGGVIGNYYRAGDAIAAANVLANRRYVERDMFTSIFDVYECTRIYRAEPT